MRLATVVDTAWIVALCALITWQDGILRFVGLIALCAQLISVMRGSRASE